MLVLLPSTFLYISILLAGITNFLSDAPEVSAQIDEGAECEDTRTTCNKDTGGKRRLQKWTRGVRFCVGGGGHIEMWQPLYK